MMGRCNTYDEKGILGCKGEQDRTRAESENTSKREIGNRVRQNKTPTERNL